jgi:hypothetical protein
LHAERTREDAEAGVVVEVRLLQLPRDPVPEIGAHGVNEVFSPELLM